MIEINLPSTNYSFLNGKLYRTENISRAGTAKSDRYKNFRVTAQKQNTTNTKNAFTSENDKENEINFKFKKYHLYLNIKKIIFHHQLIKNLSL